MLVFGLERPHRPQILAQGVSENAISIAFGIERNSRMDRGNLAELPSSLLPIT
jgi:hypothetical protein